MADLARLRPGVVTRSISPENPTGAPGRGGRATKGTGAAPARELGRGWKVSPSIAIAAHRTVDLAAITGPGRITHVWLTTHPDNWRALLLRAHWDGAATPAVQVPVGDYFGGAWNFDVPGQGYTADSTPYLGLHQIIRPDGLYESQQRFGMYR